MLDLMVPSAKKKEDKSLLIIRMDAIGDYVLFRNFLRILARDEHYFNHNITLVGNKAWKPIAEELDADFVKKFIWVDVKKFGKNLIYRYKVLREICSRAYDVVINPVYSREFISQDLVVRKLSADWKIGNSGDYANYYNWQTKISDHYYTDIIPAEDGNKFEFSRNKEFFEKLLDKKIDLQKPIVEPNSKWNKKALPNRFALLFIGASQPFKKWPIANFSEVASALQTTYGLEIVICGGPDDQEEATLFKHHFKGRYINLVGKTTLLELMGTINQADLMISNETAAPHFAVALDIPYTFVLSNGNHFGRFAPYPKSITPNYYSIFPSELGDELEGFDLHNSPRGFESNLSISDISVESVLKKIEKNFNKRTA